YVREQGRIQFQGTPEALRKDPTIQQRFLEVERGRARGYLTLPAVSPPTSCRSISANRTTTGTIASTDAAKRWFQCCTYAVTYDVMPTVSGLRSGAVISVRATMYSFQAAMKAKITAVTSPGSDSGRITRMRTPGRPQPSTAAASSISRGIDAKNARRIQMANARLKAAFVRMSAA